MREETIQATLREKDEHAWKLEADKRCPYCFAEPGNRHAPNCQVKIANINRHYRSPHLFDESGDAIQGEP